MNSLISDALQSYWDWRNDCTYYTSCGKYQILKVKGREEYVALRRSAIGNLYLCASGDGYEWTKGFLNRVTMSQEQLTKNYGWERHERFLFFFHRKCKSTDDKEI